MCDYVGIIEIDDLLKQLDEDIKRRNRCIGRTKGGKRCHHGATFRTFCVRHIPKNFLESFKSGE